MSVSLSNSLNSETVTVVSLCPKKVQLSGLEAIKLSTSKIAKRNNKKLSEMIFRI